MVNSEFEVYGLDYSEPMLEIARLKTEKKTTNQIQYQQGDAATMPFPDNSFSSIGIAFAFRNLTYKNPDRKKFLKEIYRALLLDGKFVIVETSHPRYLILRKIFHFYLKIFVAGLGGMLSGHRSAYSYLAASAIHFYKPGELKNLLEEAGFRKVNYKSLLGGIAGLTIALK